MKILSALTASLYLLAAIVVLASLGCATAGPWSNYAGSPYSSSGVFSCPST